MIRRRDPWPLLAVAVVLLWPFPYVAPIRPPNELTRAYQVRAIVEEGTLAIDGQIARHGAVFDLSTYSGGTYPNKAPGVSLLGAPVWAAWVALSGREDASLAETLFVLEKVLLALPTLLLLIFLRRWLARFTDNRWAVELAVLAWALGSVALPYALLLYGHQLAAVLLMGGFLFYVRGTETSRGAPYVLGGLLSGLAVLTEYTVAPAVLVTGLYALLAGPTGRRPRVIARRLGLVLGGAAPGLAALLWYHQAAFGGVLETPYAHLASPDLARITREGFLGVHAPRLRWLGASLFMSGKGLLYVSPWVALAVPGLWLAARPGRRAEVATIAGVLTVYLLFTAGWDPSVWGWVAGPRHLTPLMPFLAAPAAATFSWLRDRPGTRGPLWAGMAVGLTGYSVVFFVAAILVYPHYPPELEAPLFQLALPLLAEGYAVHSVGGFLLGRTGLLPHLPVILAALITLVLPAILWPGRASPQGRLRAGGAAAAILVLVFVAAWIAAPGTDRARTRDFVTGHYDPVPGSAPSFPP